MEVPAGIGLEAWLELLVLIRLIRRNVSKEEVER